MEYREIAAAATGGALNEQIREGPLRALLAGRPGIVIDVDRILPVVANAVGWCRLMFRLEESRLSRQQVAEQARETAAVAGELIERLAHAHPDIAAHVDAALWQTRRNHLVQLRYELTPVLAHLQAAFCAAQAQLQDDVARRGPRPESERNAALRRVYEAILAHSTPTMGLDDARALSANLLQAAEPGLAVPTDPRRLRRIMRGGS